MQTRGRELKNALSALAAGRQVLVDNDITRPLFHAKTSAFVLQAEAKYPLMDKIRTYWNMSVSATEENKANTQQWVSQLVAESTAKTPASTEKMNVIVQLEQALCFWLDDTFKIDSDPAWAKMFETTGLAPFSVQFGRGRFCNRLGFAVAMLTQSILELNFKRAFYAKAIATVFRHAGINMPDLSEQLTNEFQLPGLPYAFCDATTVGDSNRQQVFDVFLNNLVSPLLDIMKQIKLLRQCAHRLVFFVDRRGLAQASSQNPLVAMDTNFWYMNASSRANFTQLCFKGGLSELRSTIGAYLHHAKRVLDGQRHFSARSDLSVFNESADVTFLVNTIDRSGPLDGFFPSPAIRYDDSLRSDATDGMPIREEHVWHITYMVVLDVAASNTHQQPRKTYIGLAIAPFALVNRNRVQ